MRIGFGYRFDALNVNEKPSELNRALTVLFTAQEKIEVLALLQGFIPILRRIVCMTLIIVVNIMP